MFCRKCGVQIPDNSEFCYKCGTPTGVQPVASGNSKLWDYNDAVNKMNSAKSLEDFEAAEKILETLEDFKDSKELLEKCHGNKIRTVYDNAAQDLENAKSVEEFDRLEKIFESLGEFDNSKELLKKCREDRIPVIYENAVQKMNSASCAEDFETAERSFASLGGYKDSDELLKKCEYNKKLWLYNDGYKKMNSANTVSEHKAAAEIFASISGFEDADDLKVQCLTRANDIIYNEAFSMMLRAKNSEECDEAKRLFESLKGYKDSEGLAEKCEYNRKIFIYNDALEKLKYAHEDYELKEYADIFRSLGDFKDAKLMAEQCEEIPRQRKMNEEQENLCQDYNKALTAYECSSDIDALQRAKDKFLSFSDFADAPQLALECETKIYCIKANKSYMIEKFSSLSQKDFKSAGIKFPEKAELTTGKIPEKDDSNGRITPTVTLDKSDVKPERKSDGESKTQSPQSEAVTCGRCGNVFRTSSGRTTCPKCGTAVGYVDPDIPHDDSAKAEDYRSAVNTLKTCSDFSELKNLRNKFLSFGDYYKAKQMAGECYAKMGQIYDDEYGSIKKTTLIGLYIIMAIVIIVLFATGELANLQCTGFDEYSYEYTPTGMYALIGWCIGLNIVRGIILLCYKVAHRMN